MPTLEFAVKGPPFSVNNRNKNDKAKKNFRLWIEAVRSAALKEMQDGHVLITSAVSAYVAYYYNTNFRDIDNPIKPILDSLGELTIEDGKYHYPALVWHDDKVVNRLVVERFHAPMVEFPPSAAVAYWLTQYDEFVHVRFIWEQ